MPKLAPAVTLDPNSPTFKTPDGAADAVSQGFAQQPGEQAAVVIRRPDGTYGYSTTTSQQQEGFTLRALLPKGHTLAAIVHSHPGDDDRGQVFSTDDLNTAAQLNVPSYIRFDHDNSIRKYTPGTTKTQKTTMSGDKFGVNTAVGDPIAPEAPPVPDGTPDALVSGVVNRDEPVTQY